MTNREKVLKQLVPGATLKLEGVTYDGKESRTSTLSRTLMVTGVGEGYIEVLVGDPQNAGEQHPMRIDLPDTATYSNVSDTGFTLEDKTGDDKVRKFTYSVKAAPAPAPDQGQDSQIERVSEDHPERPTPDIAPGAAEEATDNRSDPQNLETPTQKKAAKRTRK